MKKMNLKSLFCFQHIFYQQMFRVAPEHLLLRMGINYFELKNGLNEGYSAPYAFQDRKVYIVATHKEFDNKTFKNDLALLRLERSPV